MGSIENYVKLHGDCIIGFFIAGVIVLLLTTFIDRAIREGNKSKSFLNRRFKYTSLELICYALYLSLGLGFAMMIVLLAISTGNWLCIIIGIIAGFLCSVNFFLLINHIFYDVFQKVTMNYQSGTLSVKRFGKMTVIKLDDPGTKQRQYIPPWRKSYGGRDFKFFGARFSVTVILNGNSKVKLSSLHRKHFDFSSRISDNNITVIKKQINFIF